jgi:hypothetical protein
LEEKTAGSVENLEHCHPYHQQDFFTWPLFSVIVEVIGKMEEIFDAPVKVRSLIIQYKAT